MTHKEYSIWCKKQGLNPYLKSSQDKWEKWVKKEERRQKFLKEHSDFTYESKHKTYYNPNRKYGHNVLEGRDFVRELVRIRDQYKCQDCGKKWVEGNRRFDIHHLNGLCGKKSRGYDKKEDMGGLITLCHKCHFNRPEHTTKSKTWMIKYNKILKA